MESHVTSREVRGQSRVLVLAPPQEAAEADLCVDMLATDRPHEQHVLQVTYDRSPRTVVDDWQARQGALPASMAIVCPENRALPDADLPESVYTTHVAAGDLTGVGIAVTRYLDRWEGEAETTACLDSLTSLLQYADTERAFRFLHTLTGRFVTAGATAHVHFDPATQDDQTVATFTTLFDAVVRREGDEWVVERS